MAHPNRGGVVIKAIQTLAVVGALAACLALGLFLSPLSTAQQPAAPVAAAAGRYQMFVKAASENTAVFIRDTTTGQCWFRDTNPQVREWTDMGLPVVKVHK